SERTRALPRRQFLCRVIAPIHRLSPVQTTKTVLPLLLSAIPAFFPTHDYHPSASFQRGGDLEFRRPHALRNLPSHFHEPVLFAREFSEANERHSQALPSFAAAAV